MGDCILTITCVLFWFFCLLFACSLSGEYDVRLSNYISTQLHPLCALLSDTARSLVDSVSRESAQGSAAIVSPLSIVEPSRAEGGAGRIPVARLALHMLQTPTLQLNQLHALLVDPFGGSGSANGNAQSGGFKGLVAFPVYRAPSAILAFLNALVVQSIQQSLLDRYASQSWAALHTRDSQASSQADLMQLSSWSTLETKMREQRRKREQECKTQLVSQQSNATRIARDHCSGLLRDADSFLCLAVLSLCCYSQRGVSSAASTALTRSLPRLSSLLDDLWNEPAQRCIPHLRNRLGYNIDDYTQQIRSLATQLQQQQQRYERKLQARRH